MSEHEAWAKAMEEAQDPERRDKGLWAKCFAEAGGDEAKSIAAYVKTIAAKAEARAEAEDKGTVTCPRCDTPGISKWASNCHSCGRMLNPEPRPVVDASQQVAPGRPPRSRGIYVILGVLLGMLGIHNFYIGRFGVGATQLLITSLLWWAYGIGLFITLIWVVIDLIAVKKDGKGIALD